MHAIRVWNYPNQTLNHMLDFLHNSTPYMYTQLGLSVCASYQPLDDIESPHYPGGKRQGVVMALALKQTIICVVNPNCTYCLHAYSGTARHQ